MRAKDKNTEPENQKVIGSHLQHLREEKGLSYQDIFEETKISVTNLRALENHDYERLPADTFTRGLLTLYGNFLGIDGSQVAARYIEERNIREKKEKTFKKTLPENTLAAKKLAEPSHVPSATVAALLFTLIVVSFTAFCIYSSWNPFTYFTDKTKDLSMSVIGVFKDEKAPEIIAVQAEGIILEVNFLKNTDIEIGIDGDRIISEKFTAGQSKQWSAEKELDIRLIEPASATLTLDGKPITYPDDHSGHFLLQLTSD